MLFEKIVSLVALPVTDAACVLKSPWVCVGERDGGERERKKGREGGERGRGGGGGGGGEQHSNLKRLI